MRTQTRRITPLGGFIILALVTTSFLFSGVSNDAPTQAIRQTGVVLADDSEDDYEEGVVIVQLKPNRNPLPVAARYNLVVQDQIDDTTWLMRIPDRRTVPQVIEQMRRDRDVQSVEPNYLLEVPETNPRTIAHIDGPGAADAYFQQATLQVIRALPAQGQANGSGVVVAVVDTGVDSTHPALGNVYGGYDFVDQDGDPSEVAGGPSYGHGTMVAGLIELVAPGVQIMPVRAFRPDGTGSTVAVAKAIRFAARTGANVINMSFGTVQQPQAIRGAINFAIHRAVLISSAGNDDDEFPLPYPASADGVMAVAATDLADYKAAFSNYGPHIGVSAPGVGVVSTYPSGGYASGDGTSFSTALASGTVALVLSAGGGDAVRTVEDSAVNIDALNPRYRGLLGRGRIDAYAAVTR